MYFIHISQLTRCIIGFSLCFYMEYLYFCNKKPSGRFFMVNKRIYAENGIQKDIEEHLNLKFHFLFGFLYAKQTD